MAGWHWLFLILVALMFYYIGAKYPTLISRVGL